MIAAIYGNQEVMSLLLAAEGINIYLEGDEDGTALYYSAANGLHKMVSTLIDMGAEAALPRAGDRTPLHAAVWGGHCAVVEELLSRGADHSLTATERDEIFKASTRLHNVKISNLLLEKWPNIFASIPDRYTNTYAVGEMSISAATSDASQVISNSLEDQVLQGDKNCSSHVYSMPLELAVRSGDQNAVSSRLQYFQEAGVLQTYIDQVDDSGETALFKASWFDHAEVVKLLLTMEATAMRCRHDGWTPLHASVVIGNTGIVEILLEYLQKRGRQMEINTTTKREVTALHCALDYQHWEIAKLLLDAGADATQSNQDGVTPLFIAVWYAGFEMITVILAHLDIKKQLKSIDTVDNGGRTALYTAARRGCMESVELLLKYHAKVCQAQASRLTPVFAAIVSGRTELMCLLLTHLEADMTITNGIVMTAIEAVASTCNWRTLELLTRTNPSLINNSDPEDDRLLIYAMDSPSPKNALFLLQRFPVQVCTWIQNKPSLLIHAAVLGWTTLIQMLLCRKAISEQDHSVGSALLNCTDDRHRTALMMASQFGRPHVTRALIKEEGIDIAKTDMKRRTALHHAAKSGDTISAWLLLKANGKLLNMPDFYGTTALSLAVGNQKRGVVMLLMRMPGLDYEHKDIFGRGVLHWLEVQHLVSEDACQTQVSELLRATVSTMDFLSDRSRLQYLHTAYHLKKDILVLPEMLVAQDHYMLRMSFSGRSLSR